MKQVSQEKILSTQDSEKKISTEYKDPFMNNDDSKQTRRQAEHDRDTQDHGACAHDAGASARKK